MTGIEKAIQKYGTATALGEAVGFSKVTISNWRKNGVPAERVFLVFNVAGVTPHELRPDLYPNPTDGLPAQEARQ